MRLLALLAALLFGLTAAAPTTDWTRVAARTADGGIRVGNPAARARFVEIANYTCPHCAHFAEESAAGIARLIRGGALAVEYRPITSNALSLAATLVARCAPPAAFLRVNDALYAQQNRWYAAAATYEAQNASAMASYTELDRLKLIADEGGISRIAVANGVPAARIAACFANPQHLNDTLRAVAMAGRGVRATPTILYRGQTIEGPTWADLSARLAAAGVK